MMQRPRVTPPVEGGLGIDIVEACADVANHPEDQPKAHPRLPHEHGHVLARQAQRRHPEEVQHPINGKAAPPIRIRVAVGGDGGEHLAIHGVPAGEIDLKGERDEAIGERQENVGGNGGEPAPADQLPELERRVAFGLEVLEVDGQVEAEGEEGDDDQVDQADAHGGRGDVGVEGPQVELREADGGREGLRRGA